MKKILTLFATVLMAVGVNAQAWNFSDWEEQEITETKVVDGLTVCATADKKVTIDSNNKTFNGVDYTKRLKFGGTGSGPDSEAPSRYLSFDLPAGASVSIICTSASGSEERTLNIAAGSFDNVVATGAAPAGSLAEVTYTNEGAATTAYVYSAKSGINLYAINVTGGTAAKLNEVTLWEGTATVTGWANQPGFLSDGGAELKKVGATAGDIIRFYMTAPDNNWEVELMDGHWGGMYVRWAEYDHGGTNQDGSPREYTIVDLTNLGYAEYVLTEADITKATTAQGWGGAFLLNGDGNLTVTRLSLLTEREIPAEEPEGEHVSLIDQFTGNWNGEETNTHNADGSVTYNGKQWGGLAVWLCDEANNPTDWSAYTKLVFEFAEPTPAACQGFVQCEGVTDDVILTWWGNAGIEKLECSFEGKDMSKVKQACLQPAADATYQISAIYLVKKAGEEPEPVVPVEVGVPTFNPEAGEVEAGTQVTIKLGENAQYVVYTTDGSDPTVNGQRSENDATVAINEETTIKAYCLTEKDGKTYSSEVVEAKYTVKPVEPVITEVTIETKANGYGTFCSDKALDFNGSDAKAFVAQLNGNRVLLTEVKEVPANTGILVQSKGNEVTVSFAEEATLTEPNIFVGVLQDTEVEAGTVSVLSLVNGEEGFYKFLGTTIPANKAYIPAVATNTQAGFTFIFEETDGISSVASYATLNGEAYNLNGQRVDNSYKGVVIVNGKKYIK